MDKLLASLLTVLAALLFSVGYIYLNSYYNEIGISLLEVSYSIQDVIVHSVVVFYSLFLELWDLQTLAISAVLLFFLEFHTGLGPTRILGVPLSGWN